jgi:BirA family biotin operon repressor/biotin-[acetyl-CoA-carboxylase] ligase
VSLLRSAPDCVSGAEIGRRVGISRAAVWKHVARLRRAGYRIEGTPACGYRLLESPSPVTPSEIAAHLRSKVLGRVIRYDETVDSTNRVARELARSGAVEGTVVVADGQTAGRGRLGRAWFSPPGLNLYLSVVLRPSVPPARGPQLALVAASAVAATIVELSGARPAIKWPNDVLIGGRKVAGILTEMDSEADRVTFVVVGMGINLNMAREALAPELRRTATSLRAEVGREIHRAAFAGRLLAELERRYGRYTAEGFAVLREEWESYSCLTGREVTVVGGNNRTDGRVLGIDEQGALRLRGADGVVRQILAGDVTLPGAYAGTGQAAGTRGK